jgi:hypothetical protein
MVKQVIAVVEKRIELAEKIILSSAFTAIEVDNKNFARSIRRICLPWLLKYLSILN